MNKVITISLMFFLVSCGSTQKKGKGIEIGGELYKVDDSAANIIAEEGNKEKIVCTREKVTGTHMATRNCMSLAKREELRKKNKEKFRSAQGYQGRTHVTTPGDEL